MSRSESEDLPGGGGFDHLSGAFAVLPGAAFDHAVASLCLPHRITVPIVCVFDWERERYGEVSRIHIDNI
jgi:hypothetical protein